MCEIRKLLMYNGDITFKSPIHQQHENNSHIYFSFSFNLRGIQNHIKIELKLIHILR